MALASTRLARYVCPLVVVHQISSWESARGELGDAPIAFDIGAVVFPIPAAPAICSADGSGGTGSRNASIAASLSTRPNSGQARHQGRA
jgi:hypothetical protein